MSELYEDLIYTSFPDSIDDMPYFLNITAEDLPQINMFHYYLRMGDFEAAQQLLDQLPGKNQKLIDSGKLNKFRDALIALERYYKTDIEPYINTKQTEWQGKLDDFGYKESWNKSHTYKKNNIVSKVSGSSTFLYIALQDVPANIELDNQEYWVQFTIRGALGLSGSAGSFRYEYLEDQTYGANDIVSHNNSLWLSNTTSTGVEPTDSATTEWKKILDIPPSSIPLQSETPSSLDDGDLWLEII